MWKLSRYWKAIKKTKHDAVNLSRYWKAIKKAKHDAVN